MSRLANNTDNLMVIEQIFLRIITAVAMDLDSGDYNRHYVCSRIPIRSKDCCFVLISVWYYCTIFHCWLSCRKHDCGL